MGVHLLRTRDEGWFRALYRDNYRPLLAYARRRVDQATADEVVADTFLVAWRRRDDVPDEHERLWLFGVARNTIRNASRADRRQRAVREKLRGLHAAEAAGPPQADPSGGAGDERAEALRVALGCLAEADRELLMLVAWEELSYAEIAQTLDLTANAVAIRVHRARKRFAKHVDRIAGNGEPVKERRRSGHDRTADRGRERRAL